MKYSELTEVQKEKCRAACRRWRKANPGKQLESTQRWASANAEHLRAQRKEYGATHRADRARLKREWTRKNPDYSIKRVGVDLSRFIELAVQQGGRCAVCLIAERLCVDHDHASGKVRGLLCRKCNCALGLFQDSSVNLARASAYLKEELLCLL